MNLEELHSKTIMDEIQEGKSPFDEHLVSQRTPIIQINGSYETSGLRDIQRTAGSATITSMDSEFKLSHTASGDAALLATASRGRYMPGYAAEAGIGMRLDGNITGDGVARWGYFDFDPDTQNVNDGAFFGKDTQGLFISIYRNGTEDAKIYEEDWNMPDNPSIDLTEGHVFQIRFTYYGYGLIEFRVVVGGTGDERQKLVTVHTHKTIGKTTFSNSNLQVSGQVVGDSTTEPFDLYVSGRQFAVLGTPGFKQRIVSHLVENVTIPTANYVPLMTFRRETGRRAVPVAIQEYEIITDTDILVQWRVGATLDATNYITPSGHDANETSLQVDETATTIDMQTGIKLDEDLAKGGSANVKAAESEGETISDIPDEDTVTLCARALNTEATATVIGKMVEER